jgi:hypothetical protein
MKLIKKKSGIKKGKKEENSEVTQIMNLFNKCY